MMSVEKYILMSKASFVGIYFLSLTVSGVLMKKTNFQIHKLFLKLKKSLLKCSYD